MKKALRALAGGLVIMLLALAGRTLLNAPSPETMSLPSPESTEIAAASVTVATTDLSEITAILTNLTNLVAAVIEQQSKTPLAYSASDESDVDRSFVHKQADRIYETVGDTTDELSVRIDALENTTVNSSTIATSLNTALLGVGTTTPTETLTVDGNIFGTGHMALGNRSVVDEMDIDRGGGSRGTWYWGADAVTANLVIHEESTVVDAAEWPQVSGILNYLHVNPSSNASTTLYVATENVATVPASNTQPISQVSGGFFGANNQSVSNHSYMSGSEGIAQNTGWAGTITGVYGSVYTAGTGSTTNAYGVQGWVANGGVGTTTNAYGLYSTIRRFSGTITNAYGVYIGTIQGTNNWGLYQSNATNGNYFAGNVNIGTTATTTSSKLTVVSTNVASTTLRLESPRVAIVSGNILGGIDFASNDTNLTTPGTTTASILARANETHTGTALGTDLIFSTTNGTTTAERLRILGSGNIGIGTTTPSAQLTTTGTVRFAALGSAGANLITDSLGNVTASSDERLKDLHDPFTRSISDLVKIEPITYTWKPETGYDTATVYTGFSAQNVQSAIPEAVATDTRGYLTLAERPILATVVNAIKEMWEKVMGHDAEIESLKEELRDQQAEIRALQDALNVESPQDDSPDLEDESVSEEVEGESLPVEEPEEIPDIQTPSEIDLNENTTEEPPQPTETVVEPETLTEVPAV